MEKTKTTLGSKPPDEATTKLEEIKAYCMKEEVKYSDLENLKNNTVIKMSEGMPRA